jgi:hypothetical protein
LLALLGYLTGLFAQELVVRSQGDLVRIAAPRLHFLSGKPLQRVRDGRAVPFDFQLTVSSGPQGPVLKRNLERFIFSYDLWEETFQVKRLRNGEATKGLSAERAEAWCLDQMAFSSSGLSGRAVVVRLEIRAQEPRDPATWSDDGAVSLSTLIDIFSRAQRTREQNYWRVESGVLQISSISHPGGKEAD